MTEVSYTQDGIPFESGAVFDSDGTVVNVDVITDWEQQTHSHVLPQQRGAPPEEALPKAGGVLEPIDASPLGQAALDHGVFVEGAIPSRVTSTQLRRELGGFAYDNGGS